MKRILYLTSLLCILTFSNKGLSQDVDEATDSGNKFLIGAKAGGSFSQFTQPGTVITGNLGAFGRYQALPYLQVQFDLLYDAFGGGRIDFDRDLGEFPNIGDRPTGLVTSLRYQNRHVYMHSVKGQLSARVSLPELNNAPMQPQLIVGTDLAYIFRVRENRDQYMVFQDGSRVILSNDWEEVTSDYTSINASLHFGIGLDFDLPNGRVFSVEFMYERGFTDLNDITIGQPENIEVLRTQRFNIGFSYSILNF